ncbi:major facilitator superfamily transporter [Ceratobasidium sp. AG-Ba]|nr:major facilitator superfamily transporter [Ceratobasidium sp. AG-Ba]
MAESHTQTAAGQLDPPPAFVAESGEVIYSNDAKIGPSAQDQSQNKQDTGPITASPTLFDSSTGGHNVSYQALDPTTWPKWKKRRVLFIVCAFYFLFTFITTVTVPTFNDLQTYFNISYAQVNYTVAVPALALGGWGVGPASTVGLQMLEDIYLEHERGQKVGYWCLAIDIGLLFGPLIGGFATLVSWNFPVWLTAIIFGVLLVAMLLFLPETGYPAKIPPYTIRQPNLPTNTSTPIKPLPWLNLRTLPGTMNRPKPWDSTLRFLRLFAFPNVAVTIMFYCWTWYWFILCVITMLPGAYPDYNPQVQGLLFLGFIIGTLISELLFSGGLSDYLVRRAALKNNGERIPEKRLLLYFPAAILDVYPEHVMDVTLFYSFHLNMSAFVSPFFIVPWIERIGWAWCFGAQGFIVIAGCLIFVPFLYICGRKLRDWKGPIPWGIVEIS